MRERNVFRNRCPRAGESRVRVAVDEDPVRLLALDGLANARLHRIRIGCMQFEQVLGLTQAQLVEEDL